MIQIHIILIGLRGDVGSNWIRELVANHQSLVYKAENRRGGRFGWGLRPGDGRGDAWCCKLPGRCKMLWPPGCCKMLWPLNRLVGCCHHSLWSGTMGAGACFGLYWLRWLL